jgi:hypothetical protein
VGFSIFLPTGEHVGFERDRGALLDLLAGAGVSPARRAALVRTLEESGEVRAEVFVSEEASPRKPGP